MASGKWHTSIDLPHKKRGEGETIPVRITSYRELDVYKQVVEASMQIFTYSKQFPKE